MVGLRARMKEPHPLTQFIPEGADYDSLVRDIAQSGVRDPIVLYEDKIIEGRVRARAAKEVGVNTGTRDWVLGNDGDPLEWMIRRHIDEYETTELERINLIANVLPYFRQLSGKTEERLNRATGVSVRKIRVLNWLHGSSALTAVLAGEKDVLEVGREAGLVCERRDLALGKTYGHGDKFDEAV